MKVNVIGLGYIGLPTALMFASSGVEVVGTDYDEKLVGTLASGVLTFEEEGMKELFEMSRKNGIKFTTEYQKADVYIVAVPTPYIKESKKIDPCFVVSAVESVLKVLPKGAVLVVESTVSPGTMDKFVRPAVEKAGFNPGKDVHLVHAPERILPGSMIRELRKNSRTIGADDRDIGEKIKKLYQSFCEAEIVLTDIRTAEMTKVVENTYRDINIAFANELAKICRRDDLDVYEIINIANRHPRVNILQPGPGVGGHCISVDPWFLVGDYPDLVNIILAARNINDGMPNFVLKRIHEIMEENGIKDISRIGLYGITYKEDVNDVRESPTLQMLESMGDHLAFGIKCFDPMIDEKIVENQYLDFDEFVDDVDMVVVMVGHSHIKANAGKIKGKVIFDTRNVIEGEKIYRL